MGVIQMSGHYFTLPSYKSNNDQIDMFSVISSYKKDSYIRIIIYH